ncbi:dolichyl-phosphate mannose synthase [Methanosarcina mazei]|uniref:Dolichyl-phosphate mannose synthase n=1 Tax=Methanosarcina mazei TaxID=2209 RepID=A0A0F8QQD5_METMZ|nr:glycosyltransferase family 2 protein [Methanosarcina mazei]KKG07110.1 dolichyl-phosphate mannose synthase [Methanosarcina mazei]KKH38026.1 dolichyl-phosphate mannose synthase [Methanosarcina mazei]KKH38386.1 dolichyl-phosphate mannose synthase [Methanosarcina mazei]KKH46003.1 dolichyl-phosphate mannose synthase [Methanosarcina mazei]KKH54224.1 dolichyl-phosphate mannose synthase [Methanosarcina mazei]
MSNELLLGNSTLYSTHKENQRFRETSSQNITAILPAYNEEVSIGSIVLLTKLYADNVIVIDDGSTDLTADIARKAGAEVVSHGANRGKAEAIKTGFTAAADLGADIIVTMDSDGQHNPADIPNLVAPIIKGNAEMVNGSRYLNYPGKNSPVYCRAGQTMQDTTAKMNFNLKITDTQSGFRAYAASTKSIFRFSGKKTAIENEMLADAGRSGIRIAEVEIGACTSVGASIRDPVKYTMGALRTVAEDIEANKPLYFYSVPGFALATCGFFMGFKFMADYFFGIANLNFGHTFLMVFFALAGAYMTLRGIIAHSMAGATRQTDST